MIKKITLALVILLVVIQFIPTEKNDSGPTEFDVTTAYDVPDQVSVILQGACNDCHSNTTKYPWYASIQPIGYWLNHHITDGKKHLNFSEFTNRSIAVQNHKFEEVVEMVESKEMPLESYTYLGLHPEADLSPAQRETLITWAKDQMAMLAATYPPDSLVMKRKTPAPTQ
jgi:hypothetical protein